MESFKTQKFLATVLLIAALLVPVSAYYTGSQWSVIQSCDATPFCINTTQFNQPQIRSGQFLPSNSFFASWNVKATGSRGTWDVRILTNSTNPNVGQAVSGNQSVEINVKGIIPNVEKIGHPFYIQNGFNPETCQGSFSSSCYFSADVNATGAFGNYTTFFIANSTNPHVGQVTSNNITVEIVEFVADSKPPLWRNLQINDTDAVIYNQTLNISVEVGDFEGTGGNGASGLDKAILATNETGTWKNYTSGTYTSPHQFGGQSGQWMTADFIWQNNSFTGTLGYKVWVADVNGNWNVTDVGTQQVAQAYNIEVNDTSNTQDNLDRDSTLGRNASDSSSTSDSSSRLSTLTRTASGLLSSAVNTVRNVVLGRDASDTSTTTDRLNRNIQLVRNAQESTSTNARSARNIQAFRLASDIVSYTDNIVFSGFKLRTVFDSLTASDSVNRQTDLNRNVKDSSTGTTRVDRSINLGRNVQQVADTVDAIVSTPNYVRQAASPVSVGIKAFRSLVFGRDVSDSPQSNTKVERNIALDRLVQDSTTSTGQASRTTSILRNVLDYTVSRDNINRILQPSRDVADSSSVLDKVNYMFAGTRTAKESISSNVQVSRNMQFFRENDAEVRVKSKVDRDTSIFRQVLDTVTSIFRSEANKLPAIRNVTLHVDSLGEENRVFVEVYTVDDSGLNTVTLDGSTAQVSGTSSTVVFDLESKLDFNGQIKATDTEGGSTTYSLDYTLTDNPYRQVGTANLSNQEINKSDTLTNNANTELMYNISHEDFNQSMVTGGRFTGTLQPGNSTELNSEFSGDFLQEEKQWHTDPDVRQTVYNQTIEQTVNITNEVSDIRWSSINATGTTVPQAFQPCNDCGSKIITVPENGYSNTGLWSDTGDGLSDTFVQDITDVVIGERNKYWEQYSYSNVTDKVRFNSIWFNQTIDDNSTEYVTPFIQVYSNGSWNNTLILPEEKTCNSISPSTSKFKVSGTVFKGCSKDLDGNGKAEYIQGMIGSLNQLYELRLGLGEKIKLPGQVEVGQLCSDSLEGEKFNDGELICYRNEIRYTDNVSLPTKNVTAELASGVTGLILFAFMLIMVIVVFYRDDFKDSVQNQFPQVFN